MSKKILFLIFICFAQSAHSDTAMLPKNIRTFVYRYYNASVPGTFTNDGLQKDFKVRETLGTQVIKGISPNLSRAYDELYNIAPDVASNLNLGKIDFDPRVDVAAHVFGMGWGLSDKWMIVAGIPLMNAQVLVRGGYINEGALKEAAAKLDAMKFDNETIKQKASVLSQALRALPQIKGEHLQHAIVNQLGYKPVGDWTAADIGDAKIYLQNKFTDVTWYKGGARVGMDLPTGRIDDADNLVDIAFGLGYLTTFVESLNDFPLIGEVLVLSANAKYQYNWDASRTYRLVPGRNFPLSDVKENIMYKPGNLWSASLELTSKMWRNLEAVAIYTYRNKGIDKIRGQNSRYDYSLLEDRTDFQSHTVEFSLSYSTINSYLQKKFLLPLKVGMTYSFLVSGNNTEDIRLLGLNLQAFF